MSLPIVTASAAHAGAPTTSATVTLPATQANDILILVGVNAGATAALTGPTGTYSGGAWNATGLAAAMTASWGGSWWSRCTGNHSGQTVILSGATDSCSAAVIVVRGAITSGSPLDTNTSATTLTANGMALAAFTTVQNDDLVIFCAAADDNIAFSAETMNGVAMTEHVEAASTGGADSAVVICSLGKATAGSTGAFAGTHASALSKRLMAFAIKPAPPTGVDELIFDGVDDEVRCSIGGCNLTGAFTLAVLYNSNQSGIWHALIANHDSSNLSQRSLEIRNTNGTLALGSQVGTGGAGVFSTTAVLPADGWTLCVVTKAAGVATARFHIKKQNGSWVHENASGTQGDGTTQAGGTVRFGEWQDVDDAKGRLAIAGEWNVVLSDAQVEELTFTTQDWYDNSGGQPVGLWDAGDFFATDLTGNGADQTVLNGTTQGNDGPSGAVYGITTLTPIGESLSMKWDTTGIAGESLSMKWDTQVFVGESLSVKWDTKMFVGESLSVKWDGIAAVGESLSVKWDTKIFVGESLAVKWDLGDALTAIGESLGMAWDTKVFVGESLSVKWDTRVFVGESLSVKWDTTGMAGESLGMRWSLGDPSRSGRTHDWRTHIRPRRVGL